MKTVRIMILTAFVLAALLLSSCRDSVDIYSNDSSVHEIAGESLADTVQADKSGTEESLREPETESGSDISKTSEPETTEPEITDTEVSDMENEPADEGAMLVTESFRKLSQASYFDADIKLYTLLHRGTGAVGQDRKIKFSFSQEPSDVFLFDITYTDYYDSPAEKSKRFQIYSAGEKEYFSRRVTKSGSADDCYWGANISFDLDSLLDMLPAFSDLEDIFEVSALTYTDFKNYLAESAHGVVYEKHGGVTVRFTLDRDNIIDLIGIKVDPNHFDMAEGEAVFTFDISDEGYPEAFSIYLYLETLDSTDDIKLECVFSGINNESGVESQKWTNDLKKYGMNFYYDVHDEYIAKYYVGGGASLNSFVLLSRERPEIFELPAVINGEPVNNVSWYALERAVSYGRSVIVPETVRFYVQRFEVDYCGCYFFTESERPADYYYNKVYFNGEWEMKDGKPTPTREDIIDPNM